MVCKAGMASDTLARKAQHILTAKGYPCELIRSTGRDGCGFGLLVVGSCEQVQALLQQEGIPFRSLRNERGSG